MNAIAAAADLGFKRVEAEAVLAMIDATDAQPGTFETAMDLARFERIDLREATVALVLGVTEPRRLRRLGFEVSDGTTPADVLAVVRKEVDGQAALYATTWLGQVEVREAHGHTFSAAFWRMWESIWGPRS